ncbi:bifunctional metallophosphatase/5'-nucleotidase [Paenibacillus sp. Leaf72]|uniref:bifunctional metallophosphatase/5'-nucleotidase n=1 Tax=Paenibacillus sp. Leaf72 TaxID=1736234 RepID=UPI0006F46706|nr:bifunctional UDP-sugar hydrolase/5'-nucleotidase [Paenibacillus sp. Leaf72]KQO01260.1 metallophosphoesterase [Paenibacillus sp. Leaf72]
MDSKPRLEQNIVILHTNDIHSRLENAARIASYIADQRRVHGKDNLLVLDIGDHMDRMRSETEGSDGMVNVALLNEAGYDAVTIGNNEGLTYSKERLAELYGQHAKFAVLGANMLDAATNKQPPWLLPHIIVNKGHIKIGLIGVTANFTDFYVLLGWNATDPFEAIQKQVEQLREEVDLIIVLSHLGLANDERIAQELTGVDLVLGAHTHHLLEEALQVKHTSICAAGKFGEHIGRIEITLGTAAAKPQVKAACVPTAAFEEQPEAEAIIAKYKEEGHARLNRTVACIDEPLSTAIARESPLANLLAAGLKRHTAAEIAIVNTGQLLGGLQQGEVTAGQLHALCPSPINPCKMQLTGRHIKEALEQSLLPEYMDKRIKGYGFRGEVLGTLAVDGLQIIFDSERPPLDRIVKILVNGKTLMEDKWYNVASIDMFTFHIGYLSLGQGVNIDYFLPEFIRDVLAEALKEQANIVDCKLLRWNNIASTI